MNGYERGAVVRRELLPSLLLELRVYKVVDPLGVLVRVASRRDSLSKGAFWLLGEAVIEHTVDSLADVRWSACFHEIVHQVFPRRVLVEDSD
jgi:hypothetical protein